jgi:alcohol dehydrogenase (cytochrome c)
MTDVTDTGVVTTANHMLFTGGRKGYLQALAARDGGLLWKTNLGAQMLNIQSPTRYNGRQYVAAIAGLSLFIFVLPTDGDGL